MRKILLSLSGICILSVLSCKKDTTAVPGVASGTSSNRYVTMDGQPELTIYHPGNYECFSPGGNCLPEVNVYGQAMTPLQWWIYHQLKKWLESDAETRVSLDPQLGSAEVKQYFAEGLGVSSDEFNQMNYKDFFKKLFPVITNDQLQKLFSEQYDKAVITNSKNTLLILVAPVGQDATVNPEFVLQLGTSK